MIKDMHPPLGRGIHVLQMMTVEEGMDILSKTVQMLAFTLTLLIKRKLVLNLAR
jgi:hypothetical protein